MHLPYLIRLVLAGLLVAGNSACTRSPEPSIRAGSVKARPVRAERAQLRPMERLLTATGWLAAREQATLSVKVAGRLKSMPVDLGSVVKPGDTIGLVDPRDYELRLQQAAAALAQARAALGLALEGSDDQFEPEKTTTVRLAKAVFEEATRNRDRIRNLSQAGISSSSDLDSVEANYQVSRERYLAALEDTRTRQATLAQRRAEYELAQQQLTDTNIRAPFVGVIQNRLAHLGEYLTAGSPLATLVSIDPLRLRLEIPERAVTQVSTGQAIRLKAEGDTNIYQGTVARISPALSEDNRMLNLEADIPNPGCLRPGLFVRAQIVVNARDPGLVVPANSLIVFAGIEKVITIQAGKAMEKTVTTGRRVERWVEILSGLKQGEMVVVDPGGIRTGQAVQAEDTAAMISLAQ